MVEWEQSILSCMRELMTHPSGGKLEVFVWPDAQAPGKIRLKPVVYLNTRKKPETVIDIAD